MIGSFIRNLLVTWECAGTTILSFKLRETSLRGWALHGKHYLRQSSTVTLVCSTISFGLVSFEMCRPLAVPTEESCNRSLIRAAFTAFLPWHLPLSMLRYSQVAYASPQI